MNNTIYLQRQNKIFIPSSSDNSNLVTKSIVATLIKNIESLGYVLSKDAIEAVSKLSMNDVEQFHNNLVNDIKKITGANRTYAPMYPNFPKQVMEADYAELYLNAILHYFGDWIGVRIMPRYEKHERPDLIEVTKLTVIGLGSEEDYHSMFTNLMSSKTSISEKDSKDLTIYLMENGNNSRFPKTISNKEVLSLVASIAINNAKIMTENLTKLFSTATDVLRLAVAMSDGDVSLAKDTVFKKFKRKERSFLLNMLNSCSNPVEDMFRHKGKWLRLGEILHPSEYKIFPNSCRAFETLRNNKNIEKFSTKVEAHLEAMDSVKAVNLLVNRPGEFARRLDHVLRISENPSFVVTKFAEVADKVSSPVLLQVMTHFKERNWSKMRVVFPKGKLANIKTLDSNILSIENKICKEVVEICKDALVKIYSNLPPIGKVFLDDNLKNYLVPFSQRSASSAMKTIVRGSKLDLNLKNNDTIRFFIWWKNMENSSRVDVDLSAAMLDKDWNYMEHVSYTNLRFGGKAGSYSAVHSGDITSAPNGACEFIDINAESIVKHGGRYIMMNVYSFTGQKFNEIPECSAGWMVRNDANAGEVFNAKTVQNRIDLTSESTTSIPLILDLVDGKVIWADIATKERFNRFEQAGSNVILASKAIATLKKANLHDLFSLHIKARGGELVSCIEDAETVFSIDNGITPFNIETIVGEYL